MRRCNSKIVFLLMALLLLHLLMGACIMTGVLQISPTWKKLLSYSMVLLLLAHIIFGVILTWKSLSIGKAHPTDYRRQNRKFWIARWSGFATIPAVAYHIWFFTDTGDLVRLKFFGVLQLFASVFLVVCLVVHVLTNLRGLFVSMGLEPIRKFVRDTALILLIVFAIAILGFLVYYIRWNILWR